MTDNPYVPQDVGDPDYAAINEAARKVTTENRWLKEQVEYLTWQLKQAVEEEKKRTEEIRKLRFYVGNNIVEDPE